ncbi:MAG: hypothetical protein U5J83_05315 [Bryobacterales bacterium]|nr:hypothetical protein [Bryobacterales bacterium]
MLPRRVGQPVNASSWGSGGESIDLLSGNLNYAYPLLTAQGRNGLSASLALSYNAQNFLNRRQRKSIDAKHPLAMALVGSCSSAPFAESQKPYLTISDYVFEDASGAEYPLDVLSGTSRWSPSGFAPVVEYDASSNAVWFKDGSYWRMECLSAVNEFDKNTRYPTVMQETNGNRIYVRYLAGSGAAWANSSARIWEIEDVRAQGASPRWTYRFTYNSYPYGHLASITNNIGNGEQYNFTYNSNPVPLYTPFLLAG